MKVHKLLFVFQICFIIVLLSGCDSSIQEKEDDKLPGSTTEILPAATAPPFFALADINKKLVFYNTSGEQIDKNVKMDAEEIQRTSLSPDGTKLALMYSEKAHPDKKGIYIYYFDRQELQQVIPDERASLFFNQYKYFGHSSWAPDSNKLIFCSTEEVPDELSQIDNDPSPPPIVTELKVYDDSTGETTTVEQFEYHPIGDNDQFWWAGDGKSVYHLAVYPVDTITKINIETREETLLLDTSDYVFGLFTENYNELWCSISTDESPEPERFLKHMDLETGVERQFILHEYIGTPVHILDGKIILVYRGGCTRFNIFDPATGQISSVPGDYPAEFYFTDIRQDCVFFLLGYSNPKTLVIKIENDQWETFSH